jgi:N-succinyldiaminopimelate aminotransferase
MNPRLRLLQPYPFDACISCFRQTRSYRPISLGIGEPKHPTPDFLKQALSRCALDPGWPPTRLP